MIDFVGTPPFLRIELRVAMVTAFSHSPNRLYFRNIFSHSGYPREQFGTTEKLSRGMQGISN